MYGLIVDNVLVQKQPYEQEGFIEIPDDVVPGQVWNGSTWNNPAYELDIQRLKQYRDEWWQNSTITLTNGAVLRVNDRTRRDVSDVLNGLLSMGVEEYEGWNAENGVYTMTIAHFQEASMKGLLEVKKAFDAYNAVIDQHNNTPFTSWEDVMAAFDMEV